MFEEVAAIDEFEPALLHKHDIYPADMRLQIKLQIRMICDYRSGEVLQSCFCRTFKLKCTLSAGKVMASVDDRASQLLVDVLGTLI